MVRRALLWLAGVALVAVPATLAAQRGSFFDFRRNGAYENVPYDGRFTFVRIRYASGFGRGGGGWRADYPLMEQNLTAILEQITALNPHQDGSNVHDLDDPEMLKYPVAYLSEPGYWHPSEAEVAGLQRYLAKGGFLIVDDFHFAEEWYVFERAMRRVMPAARIDRLDVSHPIFNTFFTITSLRIPYPGRYGEMGLYGEFYGIHKDNDTTKDLQVVINYNMDVGDYVEWSADPGRSYDLVPTNEAYKFMVNYVLYGMTH